MDSGKLFQALITLHAKKQLLAELVLLGLYSLYVATCYSELAQLEEIITTH